MPPVPVEPPPSEWQFFIPAHVDESGLVAVGADLEPGTLLTAYRHALFPMPISRRRIGWFSPDPRGILPIDGLHVSRSLRRSARQFTVTRDTCFEAVMRKCGDPSRPHGWIDDHIVEAYCRLHELGWAHSIEVRLEGELVGGLYGVRIERFFAGESMFHTVTDASKVAMLATVEWLHATGAMLFDVQWSTPHLASMGVIDVPRDEYLRLLFEATGGTSPDRSERDN